MLRNGVKVVDCHQIWWSHELEVPALSVRSLGIDLLSISDGNLILLKNKFVFQTEP